MLRRCRHDAEMPHLLYYSRLPTSDSRLSFRSHPTVKYSSDHVASIFNTNGYVSRVHGSSAQWYLYSINSSITTSLITPTPTSSIRGSNVNVNVASAKALVLFLKRLDKRGWVTLYTGSLQVYNIYTGWHR